MRAAPVVLMMLVSGVAVAAPPKTLDDYRYFRALSIDLVGRAPTRDEIAAFEQPNFDLDGWIDGKLRSPSAAERLVRVYMDLLRLEVPPAFGYAPQAMALHRVLIIGPTGRTEWLYFRPGQRRERPETDADLCLTGAEAGFTVLGNIITGSPTPVSKQVLQANTKLVRPWWLYKDARLPMPMQLLGLAWKDADGLFAPLDELRYEPPSLDPFAPPLPTVDIRVCNEEAQENDSGHVWVTGQKAVGPKTPPGPGRVRPRPADNAWAQKHAGELVSCATGSSMLWSHECGCGVGLERCMPGTDSNNDPRAWSLPSRVPLGLEAPVDNVAQNGSGWTRLWLGEEARQYLRNTFADDRDFRDLLTARHGWVNGPLVQFYKAGAPASCCGKETIFDMGDVVEPLVDPARLPNLRPWELRNWQYVADRGSHAAGLLTLPVFLAKFASRRGRAAALYTTFLCKSFVGDGLQLQPSEEPNLMKRPGCASCHATLEPLAAYFSRVEETTWTYLPEWRFPLKTPRCRRGANGRMPGGCDAFYDPAFADAVAGSLRGAHGGVDRVAAGPVGAGEAIAAAPELASCAVERVASSLLGRPLGADDGPWLRRLTDDFVANGYKTRRLLRNVVTSAIYKAANNRRETVH